MRTAGCVFCVDSPSVIHMVERATCPSFPSNSGGPQACSRIGPQDSGLIAEDQREKLTPVSLLRLNIKQSNTKQQIYIIYRTRNRNHRKEGGNKCVIQKSSCKRRREGNTIFVNSTPPTCSRSCVSRQNNIMLSDSQTLELAT